MNDKIANIGAKIRERNQQKKHNREVQFPTNIREQGQFVAKWLDGDFVFVREWGSWLCWTGNCWEMDHSNCKLRPQIMDALARCFELVSISEIEEKHVIYKINDFRKKGDSDCMAISKIAETILNVSHEDLGQQTDVLPVNNGTVELRTGNFRASKPTDLMLNASPVRYDKDATCPTWERFLQRVLPDASVREFFRVMVGYCLSGDVRAQKFFYLYGEGANGKSTAVDVIQSLLGRYYVQGDPSLIVSARDEHPTAIANLHGRRVASFSEVAESAKLNEVSIKQLTGGEVLSARRMRQDFWEFMPTHKIIISGNHKLAVSGTDEAVWRRPVLIKFPISLPQNERDPNLGEKLKNELSGILNWAILGSVEYYKNGLIVPKILEDETRTYREESDWCESILIDEFDRGDNEMTLRSIVAEKFVDNLRRNNEPLKTSRAIFAALERKGLTQKKSNGLRYISGIRVKNGTETQGFDENDYPGHGDGGLF